MTKPIFAIDVSLELPGDIKEIATKLGECEETKCQQLEDFRNFISERQECQPHRMDDEFLIRFFRSRLWNIRHSHRLLCNYYKFRRDNATYYENLRPLDLLPVIDAGVLQVVPVRDNVGRRILIFRFGAWKPSKFSTGDLFRATLCAMEVGAMEPITQIMGAMCIIDLQGLSMTHILHINPGVAKKMLALLVTSMPLRVTSAHVVNQGGVFDAAFSLFKPFMDSEMKKNLYIHGSDMQSLHKHISPHILPERYGGTLEDFPKDWWLNVIKTNRGIQIGLEKQGYVF